MRPGWLIGLLSLALLGLLLTVSTGCAKADSAVQETEKLGEKTAHDAKAAGETGKQDLFGWAMDLALWTIVVFLILLAVLWRYAWGPILQGLEKREHDIHSAQEEAKKARDEAQALRQKLQEEANNAQNQVRALMEQARRDSERLREEMTAKAHADIQTERERLRREVATERDQAVQHIRSQTAQLATLVASKVLRRQLSSDDHRQLVEEALNEVRQAAEKDGHNGRRGSHA